jgi:glucose dehydrogenase
MIANRNGFFYTLDRATGELLAAKPYTGQELDSDGSPSEVNPAGTVIAGNPWMGLNRRVLTIVDLCLHGH